MITRVSINFATHCVVIQRHRHIHTYINVKSGSIRRLVLVLIAKQYIQKRKTGAEYWFESII